MARATRRLLMLLAVLGVAASSACLAPTLPLPPPGKPDIEGPDQNGQVTLSGYVEPKAQVVALNLADRTEGDAAFADDAGAYELVLAAEVNDRIVLYYRSGTTVSPSIEFVIPDPNPN